MYPKKFSGQVASNDAILVGHMSIVTLKAFAMKKIVGARYSSERKISCQPPAVDNKFWWVTSWWAVFMLYPMKNFQRWCHSLSCSRLVDDGLINESIYFPEKKMYRAYATCFSERISVNPWWVTGYLVHKNTLTIYGNPGLSWTSESIFEFSYKWRDNLYTFHYSAAVQS